MSNSSQRSRRKSLVWLLIALASLSLGVAACGSDDSGDETTTATAASDPDSSSTNLDALYEGTFSDPPAEAPVPEAGKKVFIIPLYLAGGTASEGAEEAAAAMGWDATVIDGKADPNVIIGGIRQAIAADADGIFLYAVDCALVKSGLEAAKKADIPVVQDGGLDCNDSDPGAESLFTYTVTYAEGSPLDFFTAWGEAQAAWLIEHTDGEAKVIHVYETDLPTASAIGDGFVSGLEACSGCEIVDTIESVVTDLGPTIQQKIQQALLQNPDANSIVVPYDAYVTSGAAGAVRASGREGDVLVVGGEGQPANVELVRDGKGQDAGVGESLVWEGWAAMDALNRIFAGEDPNEVDQGVGLQVWDADHNLPPEGEGFQPPIDYKAAYEKAWGTGG